MTGVPKLYVNYMIVAIVVYDQVVHCWPAELGWTHALKLSATWRDGENLYVRAERWPESGFAKLVPMPMPVWEVGDHSALPGWRWNLERDADGRHTNMRTLFWRESMIPLARWKEAARGA